MPAERRSVGIEEELLVVDREAGHPVSVAGRVLGRLDEVGAEQQPGTGGSLGAELQQQQLETDTPPRTDLADLERDVREWRDVAIGAAREEGARVIASGTSPMPVTPHPALDARYQRMAERFGLTTAEHLTCACHVHVSVASPDEGVGVLDRIRVWLPVLLALSANSPFWQGRDSGYQSFRSQALVRWPTAGPYDVFGSAAGYREAVDAMLRTGVLLDEGMVYLDARLSRRYPTVEIRVADVHLDARDAVLHAALCRALADTAARAWQEGESAPAMAIGLLRLATWQAAREGLDGRLLDPSTAAPRPAWQVVAAAMEHLGPALEANGDLARVEEGLARIREQGNGAARQCAVLERTGRMGDVVAALARETAGQS